MTSTTGKAQTRAKSQTGKVAISARDLADQVRNAVKGTAGEAYRTVEGMPREQRKTMATISLGVGALLFVVGAPRLLTLLALLPALAVGGLKIARHRA